MSTLTMISQFLQDRLHLYNEYTISSPLETFVSRIQIPLKAVPLHIYRKPEAWWNHAWTASEKNLRHYCFHISPCLVTAVKTNNIIWSIDAVITILTKYSLKLNFCRPQVAHSRNVLHGSGRAYTKVALLAVGWLREREKPAVSTFESKQASLNIDHWPKRQAWSQRPDPNGT